MRVYVARRVLVAAFLALCAFAGWEGGAEIWSATVTAFKVVAVVAVVCFGVIAYLDFVMRSGR